MTLELATPGFRGGGGGNVEINKEERKGGAGLGLRNRNPGLKPQEPHTGAAAGASGMSPFPSQVYFLTIHRQE